MINRWMKGSAVALFALGMFACSSPSVGNPATLVGGDTETPAKPADPSTPSDPVTPPPAYSNPVGTGEEKSAVISNAEGGKVTLSDGTELIVPAGALQDGDSEITFFVRSTDTAAPSEYSAISPKYEFGPDGYIFKTPLTVKFPVTVPAWASTDSLTILWSRLDGAPGYDMKTTIWVPENASDKYTAITQVEHFSKGFVGAKYTVDPNPTKDPYAE